MKNKICPPLVIYLSMLIAIILLMIMQTFNDKRIICFQQEALSRGYATMINGEFTWKEPK